MNKRKIIITGLILIALTIILNLNNKSYAGTESGDLDYIENYVVTVDPNMSDGSLDITYEISWRVLDDKTEGPLTWAKIGTPNENFSNPTALTPNIKSIKQAGSYVEVYFDKAYHKGDVVVFKYSIHQEYMYRLKKKKCKYEFIPAWFTNANVKKLTVKWNKDEVKKANNLTESGNYYVWVKDDLKHGDKLKTKIEYKKDAFGYLAEDMQAKNKAGQTFSGIMVAIFVIMIVVFSALAGGGFGGGYYGHRGFYGGCYHHHYHSGCAHSSCACASSCASSCACACAGSGRAGCSKKDFYGTNLETKKIKQALK